jgi:MtN3 and saliva related transmembrane protein
MDYVSIFGYIGAACTTLAFLPQMIKTIRYRQTKDISLGMYIIFIFGIAGWLSYGILRNDMPMILANSVSFFFTAIILVLKIKYK